MKQTIQLFAAMLLCCSFGVSAHNCNAGTGINTFDIDSNGVTWPQFPDRPKSWTVLRSYSNTPASELSFEFTFTNNLGSGTVYKTKSNEPLRITPNGYVGKIEVQHQEYQIRAYEITCSK